MPKLEAETVATFRPLVDLVPDGWRTATTTAADGTALHWTAVLGAADVERPVVVGHSLGAEVAGSWPPAAGCGASCWSTPYSSRCRRL